MSVKRNDSFYKNLLLFCIFLDYIVIFMLYMERMFLTCPGYKEKFIDIAERIGIVNDQFLYTMISTSLFLAITSIIIYYIINIIILSFLRSNDIDDYKLILSILIAFSVSLLFAFCILSFTPLKPAYLAFKLLVGFSTPLAMTVLFSDAFKMKRDLYIYMALMFLIGYFVFWSEMQIFKI